MGKIVSITNQKGGVGKTTTATNLAVGLAQHGLRVLLVDMDTQGNATSGLGVDRHAPGLHGTYEVLIHGTPAAEVLQSTEPEPLRILPSTPDLAGAELELASLDRREYRLKTALAPLRPAFDYILVDTPPSLGLLTVNALTAADAVIVPVQAEYYALEGVAALTRTIDLVRKGLNPGLKLAGVLLTMVMRNNLAQGVVDEIRTAFGDKVYATEIPRGVKLAEAPSHGKAGLLYDPRSPGVVAYRAWIDEFLAREGRRTSAT